MNAADLTAALVAIDSRNPTLVPGAPGEYNTAVFMARLLESWAFRVVMQEVAPGRFNVVARSGRALRGARSLMLNGHLDVVGVDGMSHPPFLPEIRDARLFGRGSADMKSGIAAMCVAARDATAAGLEGEVVLALVVDEEYESLGTRALIASGVRADAAILTEPTRLAVCPAHRGFVWARLNVYGRAAHGSRYDIGVDAITHASLIVAELDRIQRTTMSSRTHSLLGRGSLHASTISGGTGLSTYPELCTIEIERRTLPGDSPDTLLQEIERATASVRELYPGIRTEVSITTAQSASEVPADAPVMVELLDCLALENLPARAEGMSAWTDAALLNDAGIPAICFGPGDISLAHAATEYVSLAEIDAATAVLTRFVRSWCNPD